MNRTLPVISALGTLFAYGAFAVNTEPQNQTKEQSASVFTPPGDFLLQMRAEEVPPSEILSEKVQAIIDRMLIVAQGERPDTGESRVMVGLAAPQIGISKRIILVDIGVNEKDKVLGTLEVFINPEITWSSEETQEGPEGCYSVDPRLVGIVSRAQRIHIKALDRFGNPIERTLEKFTAKIFQHELDHLDGIRFPDRIDSCEKLHWVTEDQYPEYRNKKAAWEHLCPLAVWISMKNGQPYSCPE